MIALCDGRFACALFDRIPCGAGNVFFSPLSIGAALGLVYAGARGRTADEIRAAAGFGSHEETAEAFATLLRTLASRNAPGERASIRPGREEEDRPAQELRVANGLWVAVGREVLEPFRRTASAAHGAPFEQLDFARDPDGSRAIVNRWVERATAEKVRDLVGPGQIGPDTGLVIANAAYLYTKWTNPFRVGATEPAPFFAPTGVVEVPLMSLKGELPYAETADAKVVEKEYGDGEFALRVAIPRDPNGLSGIERSARALLTLPLAPRKVRLQLPRFVGRSRFPLTDALSAMGIPSLFRYPDADLSGIDGTRDLSVSAAVHETFVRVDEHGTEAVAATTVVVSVGASLSETVKMRVDRPFLFWIVDRPTGAVLFAGRVVEPEQHDRARILWEEDLEPTRPGIPRPRH
jgi:serpin B